MVMLRAATTNAQAAELLRETLMTVFLGPLGSPARRRPTRSCA